MPSANSSAAVGIPMLRPSNTGVATVALTTLSTTKDGECGEGKLGGQIGKEAVQEVFPSMDFGSCHEDTALITNSVDNTNRYCQPSLFNHCSVCISKLAMGDASNKPFQILCCNQV